MCGTSQWTDTSFNTSMAVYWSGYSSTSDITYWSSSSFWWARWSSTWPTINLFPTNGTINFLQDI